MTLDYGLTFVPHCNPAFWQYGPVSIQVHACRQAQFEHAALVNINIRIEEALHDDLLFVWLL